MRAVLVLAMLVGLSQVRAGEEITSNAQYLAELEQIVGDHHAAVLYLGPGYTWSRLAAKVDAVLGVDERVKGKNVSPEIRNVVALAVLCDLAALSITDSKTRLIKGTKLTPIEELPDLMARFKKTAIGSQIEPEKIIRKIIGDRVSAWPRYIQFRGQVGTHDAWAQILKTQAKKDPAIEEYLKRSAKCSPCWQFYQTSVGLPNVSDTFPFKTKEPKRVAGPRIDVSAGEVVKIELPNVVAETQFDLKVKRDSDMPLHVQLVVEKGSLGAVLDGTRRAWCRPGAGAGVLVSGKTSLASNQRKDDVRLVLVKMKLPFSGLDETTKGYALVWQGGEAEPKGARRKAADITLGSK